jgi:hypothetical protein
MGVVALAAVVLEGVGCEMVLAVGLFVVAAAVLVVAAVAVKAKG